MPASKPGGVSSASVTFATTPAIASAQRSYEFGSSHRLDQIQRVRRGSVPKVQRFRNLFSA